MVKGQSPQRLKRIENYYKNKIKNAELLIDNVWDIHNASAIMRSADGFGIETINLYYTYNQFPNLKKKGKRASSSANKWLKFNKITDLRKFVKEKRKEGFKFIAADFVKDGKNLTKFKFPEKCIICFGNENQGLSEEIKKICDETVFIPMVGMVKSFNISVAASIILYELFRQRGQGLKLRV